MIPFLLAAQRHSVRRRWLEASWIRLRYAADRSRCSREMIFPVLNRAMHGLEFFKG